MKGRAFVITIAIAMIGGSYVAVISTDAAAVTLNQPPVAQHSDRVVEDADDDGEVTIRFEDNNSEDPDHVHEEGNNLLCQIDDSDSTDGNNGIQEYRWHNTTGQNQTDFLSLGNPSTEQTFPIGTYKIGLRVEDICGASDWTNFTLEVVPEIIEVYNFNDGLDEAWDTTGLWQVTDECDVGADGSYLAFTEVEAEGSEIFPDCDYDTGDAPSGSATLSLDLSHDANSNETSWYKFAVSFDHFWDTGKSDLEDQDKMTVEASFDGGETWVGSDDTDTGCGTVENDEGENCWDDDSEEPDEWRNHENVFDVRDHDYDGGEIMFRWTFDAINSNDNDNLGWLVDNVVVSGVEENEPPDAGDLHTNCSIHLDSAKDDGDDYPQFECIYRANGETDADGSLSEYRWHTDDGWTKNTTSDSSGEILYPVSDGTYNPSVTVVDDGGATAQSNTELVEFIHWDLDGFAWDGTGIAYQEQESDTSDECGVDPLAGEEWWMLADPDACSYDAADNGSTIYLDDWIDTNKFKDGDDGTEGRWDFDAAAQADLTCGDTVVSEIRIEENYPSWNLSHTVGEYNIDGCESTDDDIDEFWNQKIQFHHRSNTDLAYQQDGEWIASHGFTDELEIRFRLDASEGGTGFWLGQAGFVGTTE